MVNEVFIDLIKESAIDEDKGECLPGYPRADASQVIWSNNVMVFRCFRRMPKYDKEQGFLNAIEANDLVYRFVPEELME